MGREKSYVWKTVHWFGRKDGPQCQIKKWGVLNSTRTLNETECFTRSSPYTQGLRSEFPRPFKTEVGEPCNRKFPGLSSSRVDVTSYSAVYFFFLLRCLSSRHGGRSLHSHWQKLEDRVDERDLRYVLVRSVLISPFDGSIGCLNTLYFLVTEFGDSDNTSLYIVSKLKTEYLWE